MNRVVSTTVPRILIAVGLIMALAINDDNQNFDLTMIGWIVAGVGVLALLIAIISNDSSSRSTTRTAVRNDPVTGDRITEQILASETTNEPLNAAPSLHPASDFYLSLTRCSTT